MDRLLDGHPPYNPNLTTTDDLDAMIKMSCSTILTNTINSISKKFPVVIGPYCYGE